MADWIVEPGKLPRPAEPHRSRDPFDQLEADEAERLRRFIEWLSDWMDARFEMPLVGWRFGIDALAGLVPGVGDLATTAVSLFLIGLAGRFGLPRITIARMTLNVMIDMLVGAVPLVGDVFDVWWKANQRNAQLLAERLDEMPDSRRAGQRLAVRGADADAAGRRVRGPVGPGRVRRGCRMARGASGFCLM